MFDYLLSFVLLGLGIRSPLINPNVKGVTTVVSNASASALHDRATANHEIFQAKLASIKDTKKRTIVEHVQTRMTEINTQRTNAMIGHLTVMTGILDRVASKASELQRTGKDISSVTSAVALAKTAIGVAQDAVTAQITKTYDITITTENALKNNVLTVRKALATDVLATHQKIVTARKAVYNAIKALAILRGEPVPEAITN